MGKAMGFGRGPVPEGKATGCPYPPQRGMGCRPPRRTPSPSLDEVPSSGRGFRLPALESFGPPAATLLDPTFPGEVPLKAILLTLLSTAPVWGLPGSGDLEGIQLPAQPPAQGLTAPGEVAAVPDAPLRVFLLTMDQGDEVWEKFGHNALLVRNEATGEEVAWNWGLFNFGDVDFIPRFLRGTMRYSMGGFPPDLMLREYIRADRTVYANEVRLSPSQAAELDAFVRWNALEENRHYIYDYFRDNCSTRVRDVLDQVLDGRLRAYFQDRVTPHSYRWHTRRLVQGTAWIDQGLSFLLGFRGDRPITEWEGMFIPMEMLELLEEFQVAVPGETGGPVPLLGPRQVVYQAARPPAPATPPSFSFGFLVAGLSLSAALVGLTVRIVGGARRPGARILLAGLVLGWSLVAGALGVLLLTAWFTDHVFIQWNLNLFYLSPLALPMGLLFLPSVLSPERARRWPGRGAWRLAATVAAFSLLVALLQGVRLLGQGNAEVVAVALPVNLALAWVVWTLHRSTPTPTSPPRR